MLTIRVRRVVTLAITVVLSLTAVEAAARPIIVGTGTPESCMEAALQLALLTAAQEGGGRIQFDCGAAPASIAIGHLLYGEERTARLTLPDKTTIDGGDLITIDGGWRDGVLILVPANARAGLRRVTVRRGWIFSPAIISLGALDIDRCTIRDSLGGAIWTAGDLRVRQSVLTRNGSFIGDGGIFNLQGGNLTVDHTAFLENGSDFGGGGIENAGSATVRNSVFARNFGHWRGGAFRNLSGGDATIDNSEVSNNLSYHDGGAVANEGGTLLIRNTVIAANSTDHRGGGLFAGNGSVTTLLNSQLSGNLARSGGGGVYVELGGTLLMTATTVSGNLPEDIVRQ